METCLASKLSNLTHTHEIVWRKHCNFLRMEILTLSHKTKPNPIIPLKNLESLMFSSLYLEPWLTCQNSYLWRILYILRLRQCDHSGIVLISLGPLFSKLLLAILTLFLCLGINFGSISLEVDTGDHLF